MKPRKIVAAALAAALVSVTGVMLTAQRLLTVDPDHAVAAVRLTAEPGDRSAVLRWTTTLPCVRGWEYRYGRADGPYGTWRALPSNQRRGSFVVGLSNRATYRFEVRSRASVPLRHGGCSSTDQRMLMSNVAVVRPPGVEALLYNIQQSLPQVDLSGIGSQLKQIQTTLADPEVSDEGSLLANTLVAVRAIESHVAGMRCCGAKGSANDANEPDPTGREETGRPATEAGPPETDAGTPGTKADPPRTEPPEGESSESGATAPEASPSQFCTGPAQSRHEFSFDDDSDRLDSNGVQRISAIAKMLAKETHGSLVVEGHASGPGRASYNLDLAERRAQTVIGRFDKDLRANGASHWLYRAVVHGESHNTPRPNRHAPDNRQVVTYVCSNADLPLFAPASAFQGATLEG